MKATKRRETELTRLTALADEDIDTSDIPERVDWSGAEIGKFYRPIKQQVTLRLDADVLAWFKAQGGRYQSSLNAALRDHMTARTRKRAR